MYTEARIKYRLFQVSSLDAQVKLDKCKTQTLERGKRYRKILVLVIAAYSSFH
jgi:hypothetical protein